MGYLDSVIGNDKTKRIITNYLITNKMPHAFIIEGAVGSGRKHIAKSIAQALSCKSKDNQSIPCCKCINCEKISHNTSPDVITIDSGEKSSIGVEAIRDVINHTYITPNELDLKVYIIDGADKMTQQAQNAFLKTLEEPVTQVMYFLVCENSQMLLPTITSRAQTLRTSPIDKESIYTYLNFKFHNRNDLHEISALARGNLGVALKYLNDDQAMSDAKEIRDSVYTLLELLSNKPNKSDIYSYYLNMAESSENIHERLRLIYSSMRDVILYKELHTQNFDFFIDEEDIKKYISAIKPKFAKKMTAYIEQAISSLYLNQGSSSENLAMFKLAKETWLSRN